MEIIGIIKDFWTPILGIATLVVTYKGYTKQKDLEREDRLHQQKVEKYEIFMRSLFGLYRPVNSCEPEYSQMKKEFILNFYRIHVSCSSDIINRISSLLEALKVDSSEKKFFQKRS